MVAPNAGVKINETEVGGRFRPLSEITGVCHRCREQIAWKRKYGKYKKLTEPAKCQKCLKRMFVKHITSYALVVPRSRKCVPSVILLPSKSLEEIFMR
ncbi:hypothetical protein HA466_0295730 [Hirschfeldia incana]|nr:hypothetical protein HA466_0295730 [Hirschfeldia incana]